jgi:hypothetical protein
MRTTKPMYVEEFPEYGRVIVVGEEAFDWGLDREAIRKAIMAYGSDQAGRRGFTGNVISHLTASFSEFIGRQVTLAEINHALEVGEIEVEEDAFQ